jgi:hypothetical protein
LISPEAVSSAWAPVPAWSPTRSVVPLNDVLTTLTLAGPELADALELLDAFDPPEPEPELAPPEFETELEPQAARSAAAASAERAAAKRRRLRVDPSVVIGDAFRVHAQLGEQAIA